MSKTIFLSYGNDVFINAKERIKNQALEFGFDQVNIFGPSDLSDEFKEKTKTALNNFKGGGYWIWKTYCLKKIMDEADLNDIIVYCDAGCSVNKNGKEKFDEYIKMLKSSDTPILSHEFLFSFYKNCQYTKKDVFDFFNITKEHEIYNKRQLISTVIIMIKTEYTIKLINEYYDIAINNPNLFTDTYITPNYPEFIDHRHDQSIFSILRYLRGSVIVPDTTWGPNCDKLKEPFIAYRNKD